jgi:hypothetical protein
VDRLQLDEGHGPDGHADPDRRNETRGGARERHGLHRLIECDMAEVAYLDDDPDHIMILDEEGKLKHKPMNEEATKVYGRWPADFIVDHALVCAPGELR